ncbi:MAG TPA: hypothetical protein PK657_06850 [Legionella sp.]|nr:hypothetical protein [Legionella sp.]
MKKQQKQTGKSRNKNINLNELEKVSGGTTTTARFVRPTPMTTPPGRR